MADKITYGLSKIYYSVISISEGTVSYGTPVAMPGASELTLSPVGDDTPVYADNGTYVTLTANQGYEGTLTLYKVPDSFKKDVLGMTEDTNKAMIESSEDVKVPFALLGQFETDTTTKKRFVLYNCTAGRCDFGSKTKEASAEAATFAIPITASPSEDLNLVKATLNGTGTVSETAFNGWFTAVYTPSTT